MLRKTFPSVQACPKLIFGLAMEEAGMMTNSGCLHETLHMR
jgi:hypothetical protein